MLSSFFNLVFLLVIWEFHIMYPDHTHFQVLPGLDLSPCELPHALSKIEGKKKHKTQAQFMLSVAIGAWSNSQRPASQRKLNPSPPTP